MSDPCIAVCFVCGKCDVIIDMNHAMVEAPRSGYCGGMGSEHENEENQFEAEINQGEGNVV